MQIGNLGKETFLVLDGGMLERSCSNIIPGAMGSGKYSDTEAEH